MENGSDCCSGQFIYVYTLVQCLLKIHSHNYMVWNGSSWYGRNEWQKTLVLVKIMPHPFPPLRKWNLCSSHASQFSHLLLKKSNNRLWKSVYMWNNTIPRQWNILQTSALSWGGKSPSSYYYCLGMFENVLYQEMYDYLRLNYACLLLKDNGENLSQGIS